MIKIWKVQYDELIFKSTKDSDKDVKELAQNAAIDIDYTYNGTRKRLLLDGLKGFLCDGASVPRLAYFVLKPWYTEMQKNIAAIVHDMIFVFGGDNIDKTIMPFHEANELFRALLDHFNTVCEAAGTLAFAAVDSWFGKRCYRTTNKYDKHNYDKIEWGWI